MIMQYPSEQTIRVSSIISKKHILGTIRSMFVENLKLNSESTKNKKKEKNGNEDVILTLNLTAQMKV